MINFKEKLDNNTFDKNFKNLNFNLKEIKKKSDLKEKNEKNKIPIYCEVNQADTKLFKIIEKNNKLINKNKMTIFNIKYLILFINSNIFYNSSTLLKSLLVIELI
jgi:DNA-binding transcriptional MerR regulator